MQNNQPKTMSLQEFLGGKPAKVVNHIGTPAKTAAALSNSNALLNQIIDSKAADQKKQNDQIASDAKAASDYEALPWYKKIFSPYSLQFTGNSALKTVADPAVKAGVSAVEAPVDIARGAMGKPAMQNDITLPSGEKTKTIQADANNEQDKVIAGEETPLQATGKVVGDTVGGAMDFLAGEGIAEKTLPEAIDKIATLGEKAAPYVDKLLSSGGDAVKAVAKKVFLGDEGTQLLSKLSNPEAMKFVPKESGGAGKGLSDVVDSTSKAVNSFVTKSKAALQAVKNDLPNTNKIPSTEIATRVNQAIMNAIQGNAEFKGVAKDISLFKDPQELINSGLLKTEEAKKVEGIVKAVQNWKDSSSRGLLNLKEQLGSFYDDGLNNSNKILSNIQNGLKDLVSESAPTSKIKTALKTASDNIDKADRFTKLFLGNSAEQAETKLNTIARSLKNPATKMSQLKMLKELESVSGYSPLKELQGYTQYLDLLKDNFPTKVDVAKDAVKRAGKGIVKTAKVVGGAGLVGEGINWLREHI